MTCHRVNVIHSIVTRFFFYGSANSTDDANLFDPAGLFLDKQLIVLCLLDRESRTIVVYYFLHWARHPLGMDCVSRDFRVDFGSDPLSNWHRQHSCVQ